MYRDTATYVHIYIFDQHVCDVSNVNFDDVQRPLRPKRTALGRGMPVVTLCISSRVQLAHYLEAMGSVSQELGKNLRTVDFHILA